MNRVNCIEQPWIYAKEPLEAHLDWSSDTKLTNEQVLEQMKIRHDSAYEKCKKCKSFCAHWFGKGNRDKCTLHQEMTSGS